MNKFYIRFSELLKDYNFTQKEFALRYHFSKNQVHYWVKNKAQPDFDTFIILCNIFNVSADYLLGRTDY